MNKFFPSCLESSACLAKVFVCEISYQLRHIKRLEQAAFSQPSNYSTVLKEIYFSLLPSQDEVEYQLKFGAFHPQKQARISFLYSR
jgi:hypothetical protein